MIVDILVHVDATVAGEGRLSYAFDLAEQHHARLSGVHVVGPTDVPPLCKPSMVERVASVIERVGGRCSSLEGVVQGHGGQAIRADHMAFPGGQNVSPHLRFSA